ncbi:transcription factor Iwr1 [Purpureocillium lavendulum]|uniref:Transcription factor Iwr1 n=1 Tax=Purpureocillium lavendulum TaxID=1247861 RepID=A0AB34G454_9HYPO|nr:transcription factor Iwr1 [Purpureocillium lavendulum]
MCKDDRWQPSIRDNLEPEAAHLPHTAGAPSAMSIPPQLIRVKRKRVEEAPVQFLQFDASQKRHRSGNWAYQRRDPAAEPVRADKPVIHTSRPEDASPPTKKHQGLRQSLDSTVVGRSDETAAAATQASSKSTVAEPRRFRVSRSATLSAGKRQAQNAGVSKRDRYSPAVFVEGTKRKKLPRKSLAVLHEAVVQPDKTPEPAADGLTSPVQQKDLKRPGVRNKAGDAAKDGPVRRPLPESLANRQHGNMEQIAADMDQWVLNEIGANLHGLEQDKQSPQKPKFKPKAPVKRFHERHPELAQTSHIHESAEVAMTDASDDEAGDDDADWIIEEYVRVPALSISVDVPVTDIGVLELDDDEDSILFLGLLPDDEDDADEEDEDENDYPEDEVDSDDEFGRHAYLYRNTNASDEEEFDNTYYSGGDDDNEDDLVRTVNEDDDDDVRMARIRAYMKRHSAFP